MRRSAIPLLFGFAALLSACDTNLGEAGADMRVVADLRMGAGNPIIGQICDDNHPCPAANGNPVRCAVTVQFDQVGFCAAPCSSDSDCDTVLPGQSRCANMTGAGTKECVLLCNKTDMGAQECPDNWTCVAEQTFFLCRPPQVIMSSSDMGSDDMN